MDAYPLVREILKEYQLSPRGIHGVVHWARVLENGLEIAKSTGADVEVVTLFALFHDSRRETDGSDPDHGLRGGEYARTLRGTLIHLDDERFEILFEACRLHTRGLTRGDITSQTCWDADRLDLGRVGVCPVGNRLCTDAARKLIPWAYERSVKGFEPGFVSTEWDMGKGSF